LLPPLLFPGSTSAERRRLARLVAAGRIRRVGPRLYASVPDPQVVEAVRGTWSTVVATLFPDALISHRTALGFTPSPAGEVFVTASTNREVRYPGLRIRFVRGPGPLADDPKFLTIRSSSLARALLENLATTRPGTRSRAVPIEQLEQRLEQILHVDGEAGLHQIRDRAREVAHELGWSRAFTRLDGVIGALLGTRVVALASSRARARAAGEPFDPACLERLHALFGELRSRPLPALADPFDALDHQRNKAFFEAYFSNYIEGTTFELEEAEQIVFDHQIPARRLRDAHDIVGTFRIVSDPVEIRRTPRHLDDAVELLRSRHRTLLAARPEADPGAFKTKPNRAGETHCVHPDHVVGTLRKGVELYGDLPVGLARAIFMMFLVADVHPFVDGNGRIARIMMNAELTAAGRSTIIVPTVVRDDYLLALRALTRRHRPAPIVQLLTRAQRFSTLEFSPYPVIVKELQRRNWFREPDLARIID
jgi:hypothetical protein